MTDHPLTETAAAEMWDAKATPTLASWGLLPRAFPGNCPARLAILRAAFDAGREHEREHADPHHDPRPWQDCTREDIRKDDMVETQVGDRLRISVAHHQDEYGNWYTKLGYPLSYDDNWPLRRIPAPTPPAEEVELPGEHPAHLLDVEGEDGDVCAYMALDRHGDWRGVDQDGVPRGWIWEDIAACTIPEDGTRARRDGDRPDGEPRFVKAQEGEK